jgi:starvation-inducible outer membrane lipoprotein
MKNKSLWLIPLSFWLAGCSDSPREVMSTSKTTAVSVSVVTVAEQKVPSIYEATGTVRAGPPRSSPPRCSGTFAK